ncbi:bone morphogenetic protein 15 [Plectropomus leopardus]|uniref:bone morphogenetic protein 15 n=1 Tax=Plectropomus leopardus TaxID=160734 RepID=UPI001C4C1197|nr:bone morphogenetic protein 15 [Plectropomus leopardus]
MTIMKATCITHSLLRVCVLSCFIFLLCSTCTGVVAGREMASHHRTLKRVRRSHQSAKHKGAHHRPLTDEQKADQNLQFMLSLYRSAAEPDGRPKQHRKFGSNTVRLLRPSASSVHYLPASGDHHYSFTVQYNLDTLPSEQLIRASFIHLRSSSSSSSSSSTTSSTTQALQPPRCRAQITSLGKESLVILEPHEQWTETDITAHVQRGKNQGPWGHLTLTAQYWCTDPGHAEEDSSLSWWWLSHLGGRDRWRGEPHFQVPSLLLYLEEEREVKDWMGDLLGTEGDNIMRRIQQWHPSVRRRRRSKDVSSSEAKDTSLDVLKNAPTSSSSFSTSPSSSIISDIPNYKRKTSTPKNRCKLHSFRLSFDELGWGHYFIAPPVYNPRFCQGNCPRVLPYGFHSPNHAIIQTVINDLGVGDVPPPSCVPYKYMPMSVLVVHKKKVEYKELEDMVAESCTCR